MRILLTVLVALWSVGSAWASVDIREIRSPGGIYAWLVEEHSIPFVAIEIEFRGGTSLDIPGKRGATNLMTGLIEEGTGDLDSRAYAEALEALAAVVQYNASGDGISISARFLTENRDEAAALLREAIHRPRFDPQSLERVRAQVIAGLLSDAQNPDTIAENAFFAMAHGDHPYGSDGRGTVESVDSLTRRDIVDAHRAALTRDRLVVGVVGDITARELEELLDTLLGDLPETGVSLPEPAPVQIDRGLTVIPLDTPQSVALFGHAGIDRDDPDFLAAIVVNQIFGSGSLNSRLMQEARVKRGLTYGINTYPVSRDHAALFLGSTASSNQLMAETIAVIRNQWSEMMREGVTEKELERAKTYLTGAYPLRFDGNSRIAGILVGMQVQGLPIDYIATRNDRVNALTLEDVNRVAARLLRPDQLHFVVVGQPVGLETAAD